MFTIQRSRMVKPSRWKARDYWFDSRLKHNYVSVCIFRLLPDARSSAKPIIMKSSMTSIKSNGCKEIDLILEKCGGGIFYDG